ncbi:hypothetical protein SAMN06265365_101401 [Tistlia consotensis]|uniref:DUF2065 domain-containing protein n=1 Tax=Tistlia consotensis USBA 355 TaxID=560819 RepID=A0A1Y6B9B0_9PROT|nr:DUF2065 domain-containing protein [Tistlia consotensis]SME91392.1 hypothetical protein SAMN05428998_101399 [Tistlia consotensis USBA 355]SNR27343.1 hypothetical protein SAMN06265365_101401 [Tistlia consotensis]
MIDFGTLLIAALAMVMVLEGLFVAIAPGAPRRLLEQLAQVPPEALRWGGLLSALFGFFVLWLLLA